jgi:hypothetical protein
MKIALPVILSVISCMFCSPTYDENNFESFAQIPAEVPCIEIQNNSRFYCEETTISEDIKSNINAQLSNEIKNNFENKKIAFKDSDGCNLIFEIATYYRFLPFISARSYNVLSAVGSSEEQINCMLESDVKIMDGDKLLATLNIKKSSQPYNVCKTERGPYIFRIGDHFALPIIFIIVTKKKIDTSKFYDMAQECQTDLASSIKKICTE